MAKADGVPTTEGAEIIPFRAKRSDVLFEALQADWSTFDFGQIETELEMANGIATLSSKELQTKLVRLLPDYGVNPSDIAHDLGAAAKDLSALAEFFKCVAARVQLAKPA